MFINLLPSSMLSGAIGKNPKETTIQFFLLLDISWYKGLDPNKLIESNVEYIF